MQGYKTTLVTGLAVFGLLALASQGRAQDVGRARLLTGELRLSYERYSSGEKKTIAASNEIRATGSADLNGYEVEAALTVDVRATKQTLLETSVIAGLNGSCQILVDGDEVAVINMALGRTQVSLLGSLLDAGIRGARQGEPSRPDVEFGRGSNKAEWTAAVSAGKLRGTVLVRFVYREATNSLLYYVFVEQQ